MKDDGSGEKFRIIGPNQMSWPDSTDWAIGQSVGSTTPAKATIFRRADTTAGTSNDTFMTDDRNTEVTSARRKSITEADLEALLGKQEIPNVEGNEAAQSRCPHRKIFRTYNGYQDYTMVVCAQCGLNLRKINAEDETSEEEAAALGRLQQLSRKEVADLKKELAKNEALRRINRAVGASVNWQIEVTVDEKPALPEPKVPRGRARPVFDELP